MRGTGGGFVDAVGAEEDAVAVGGIDDEGGVGVLGIGGGHAAGGIGPGHAAVEAAAEDAGCADREILDHLRAPLRSQGGRAAHDYHSQGSGCWVVDALLRMG